ncbi:hypothetical protein GUITHDRAFT_122370 [Guillardia theta CCMP2712]|uniref:Uncharacterized protein n=1 Tax=Guillardia theta (strain CCMP2712) TaxID=905079 RepID=L1I596_GUITC|nr:hypothetical protein GUITHDRAFT_122370 [Guillardia theta CCMP2712]EKX31438.1 hypothetical protein GUITHDRAFT_122370 [Guillardia theta CCMP2712]|eukprot:XP_005818418.1 hypothetical protein GUITHDRAFT_122370 [Guillardia theta CCMP2712]
MDQTFVGKFLYIRQRGRIIAKQIRLGMMYTQKTRCGGPCPDVSEACFLCIPLQTPDDSVACPDIFPTNVSTTELNDLELDGLQTTSSPSSSPDQPLKPRWDADARRTHSQACTGKSRLSVQERLDIVCMYYSAPSSTRCRRTVHQWDIARMYGKSRAAISKVLKPEYARRVMMTKEGEEVPERDLVLWRIRKEGARRAT